MDKYETEQHLETATEQSKAEKEEEIEKLVNAISSSRDKYSNQQVRKRFMRYRLLGPFRRILSVFKCFCCKERVEKFT
jgi:hypothetical protein